MKIGSKRARRRRWSWPGSLLWGINPVGWKREGQVIVGSLDGHKTRYHGELRRDRNRASKSKNSLNLGRVRWNVKGFFMRLCSPIMACRDPTLQTPFWPGTSNRRFQVTTLHWDLSQVVLDFEEPGTYLSLQGKWFFQPLSGSWWSLASRGSCSIPRSSGTRWPGRWRTGGQIWAVQSGSGNFLQWP